jgi:tryptophan synthase alpha chain
VTIAETFAASRARGELALIPYLTAGFPNRTRFVEALLLVAESGADIIEIGIPFSDPIADGPTIQRSSQIALAGGTRLERVFEDVAALRLRQPLVLMSYLNPLLAFGRERLFAQMRTADVAGAIVPDLPVEESDDWGAAAREYGRDLVFLAAPTSTGARLREIGRRSRGFVYAVSLLGTTGARQTMYDGLPGFLSRLRAATSLPVAVGFGISSPGQVGALRGLADGVVVGSRLVAALDAGEDLGALVRSLKTATRAENGTTEAQRHREKSE